MQRRKFLKGSLALAATPFLGGCAFGGNGSVKPSLVQNGSVKTSAYWGMMDVSVKDGVVTGSKPLSVLSSIPNPLRGYTADMIYKCRIKHPMVRKSYLENPDSPKPELRGQDEWVQVKYEDAIKLVARELKKTRAQRGLASVYAKSPAWKSSGNFNSSTTLLARFMNLTGGFVGGLGDYSTGAGQVIMPHVMGGIEVYEQQTTWPVVLENSKVVVIWGSDPVATLRVGWTATDELGYKYLEDLKNSDKEIIIIDPIKSLTGNYFDGKAKWIAPVPNTDTAMMLGMAYHLYKTKNYDKEFLESYTVGFDKFLPYLLGKKDGKPKTPKWASKICGVSEKVIKELAVKMYKNRTMIMGGWAMQRAHHGEQPYWMLVTLAAMLGQIGLPGGGFGFSYHYSGGGVPTSTATVVGGINPADIGVIKDGKFKGYAKDVADEKLKAEIEDMQAASFPVARIADVLLNPGKTIDHNGKKITYPDIDFIYWAGGNPFGHQQNLNKLKRAWQKPRTVVVNEIYWTPTAKMADIVFPVTTLYERDDITMVGDYSNQYIMPMKQVVAKQNEAKDDYQIFSDLSKAYADGVAEIYTDGAKEPLDFIKSYYDSAAKVINENKALGVKMPKFSEWWEKNEPTKFDSTAENEAWVRHAEFREDPILNALGTPSGLIEIYSETIANMNYDDCKGHAMWMEPAEWLGAKKKSASIHLLNPHPSVRLHSQLGITSLRDTYAVADREPILINTKNAKKLGIKTGDIVRVYNKRGEILAGAVVSDDVSYNVARLCEGAWYDPDEKGVCKNGCINVLTNDIPASKLSNANISHTTLVNIKKFKGEAPELSAFKEPKFSV